MADTSTIFDALGRHSVHSFPARMAPGLALSLLQSFGPRLRVLDPMAGSGTVPAVARARGHYGFGVDIDPLAVLISKVWTTALDKKIAMREAERVLAVSRFMFDCASMRSAYPINADESTRRFVRYWFDPYCRKQLSCLALEISAVRDEAIRDVLWCAFSRMIITKQAGASLAMDLSHSRPHRHFKTAPIKPFNRFLISVEQVVSNVIATNVTPRGPATRIYRSDARSLPLSDDSIDLVITSPPYLNAIDYMRCSKFSLVWMGHNIDQLTAVRSGSIGTEVGSRVPKDDSFAVGVLTELRLRPQLPLRQDAILRQYVRDMRLVFGEIKRVLAPGGQAVCVIGENTIRSTYVPTAKIISILASESGLRRVDAKTRILPPSRRYLPPPQNASGALDRRIRREVITTYEKS